MTALPDPAFSRTAGFDELIQVSKNFRFWKYYNTKIFVVFVELVFVSETGRGGIDSEPKYQSQ